MHTLTIISTLLIILLIVLMYITYINAGRLAEFRESIIPNQLVFFLDRPTNKYLAATTIKKERVYSEHTLWRVEIHSEDGDYTLITSELNLFDKKY